MLEKLKKNEIKIGFLLLIFALLCILIFVIMNNRHSQKLQNYITTLKGKIINKNDKNTLDLQFPKPVIYQADSLRSPFQETRAIKKSVILNPLLTYPLNMLRLVGTLSKDNKLFAYVLAPDNKLYQVTVGKKIGDHNGKVSAITPSRLEVIEQDSESGKPLAQHKVVLQLKDVN